MYMVQKPPKYDDVICEQPLTVQSVSNKKILDEALKADIVANRFCDYLYTMTRGSVIFFITYL